MDEPLLEPLTPPHASPSRTEEGVATVSTSERMTGSAITTEKKNSKLSEQGRRACSNVTREELMRQMVADIARYSLEREREFGYQNGYELYFPTTA